MINEPPPNSQTIHIQKLVHKQFLSKVVIVRRKKKVGRNEIEQDSFCMESGVGVWIVHSGRSSFRGGEEEMLYYDERDLLFMKLGSTTRLMLYILAPSLSSGDTSSAGAHFITA